MPDPLTLTAYAARRGVSTMSVSRAIASGRLVASVGRTERGRPTILDPELADREWADHTRQRADQQEPDAPEVEISAPLPRAAGLPDGIPPYKVSQAIRAAAAARRETSHANLAELEEAKQRGRLVDAKEAYADIEAHISMAKTRLMSLPSQLAQDMPDLADRVVPVAERRVREVLEELALDGPRS